MPEAEAPNQTTAPAATEGQPVQPDPSAETKKPDATPAENMIPQSRFNEVVNRLRTLEKEQADREAKQAEEEEKRLKEQAQWQTLAENRQAKIQDLTVKAELADRLSAMVLDQFQAEIKEWPEEVKAMQPGDDADVLAKLDWMQKAKPLAKAMLEDKTPTHGTTRRPTPAAPTGTGQRTEQARDAQAGWTRRNF